MAAIRRHAPWLAPLTCVLVGTLVFLWTSTGEGNRAHANATAAIMPAPAIAVASALRQDGYTQLDAVAAGRIAELRRAAGLDDDILAALNLSAPELLQALAALRSWYETNVAQLDARRQAIAEQRNLVRTHQSAINNGQDAGDALRAARTRLAQAEAEWATFVGVCRQTVLGQLSETQSALVERMRSRKLPMPYRVLALAAEQESGLRGALLSYEQRRSTAADAGGRSSAREAFDRDLEAAVGSDNVAALGTLHTYMGPSSERLVAALQTVLPVESDGAGS